MAAEDPSSDGTQPVEMTDALFSDVTAALTSPDTRARAQSTKQKQPPLFLAASLCSAASVAPCRLASHLSPLPAVLAVPFFVEEVKNSDWFASVQQPTRIVSWAKDSLPDDLQARIPPAAKEMETNDRCERAPRAAARFASPPSVTLSCYRRVARR